MKFLNIFLKWKTVLQFLLQETRIVSELKIGADVNPRRSCQWQKHKKRFVQTSTKQKQKQKQKCKTSLRSRHPNGAHCVQSPSRISGIAEAKIFEKFESRSRSRWHRIPRNDSKLERDSGNVETSVGHRSSAAGNRSNPEWSSGGEFSVDVRRSCSVRRNLSTLCRSCRCDDRTWSGRGGSAQNDNSWSGKMKTLNFVLF